jgi:hypothetical protein
LLYILVSGNVMPVAYFLTQDFFGY